MPRKIKDYTCQFCGKTFKSNGNLYCSKQCCKIGKAKKLSCHRKPYRKREKTQRKEKMPNCTCQNCGEKFYVMPHIAKTRKYCSWNCTKVEKHIEKTCDFCGETFVKTAPVARRRKYCSLECAYKDKTTKVSKKCKTCGKIYEVSNCKKDASLYCSKACYVKHTGETTIEELMRKAIERKGMFYFQEHDFGRYAVDFYLPAYFIVIECDGEYWHSSEYAKKRDKRKDNMLKELGITVFRFTGKQIKANPDKCVKIALS